MTIYSVGYERLVPSDLKQLADELDATVVDVRSITWRSKKGFSGTDLKALLKGRYLPKGTVLGGRGEGPTEEGLQWLVQCVAKSERNLILLCKEEAAGECHRHHRIAVPLLAFGVDVVHIYQGEQTLASELKEYGDQYGNPVDTSAVDTSDCLPPTQSCSSCS